MPAKADSLLFFFNTFYYLRHHIHHRSYSIVPYLMEARWDTRYVINTSY